MRLTRYPLAIAIIVAGISTSVHMVLAESVVPPQSDSFKQTYGQWGGRWWQYVLGIPDNPAPDENPLNDPNGERCNVGQWGPVFFLVGTTGGSAVRSCEAPADTGLFFPIQNIFCAIPEDGDTPAAISQLCSDFVTANYDVKTFSVTIDNKSVPNLQKFRASSFFSFTGGIPGVFRTSGCNLTPPPCYENWHETAFSDGYWIMVNALKQGQHTIRFKGGNIDVTYNLTIVPQ
jgi:hypothetical protein